ncbi:bifunctional peptidase and arginyl-hydroxylase JMJD5 [Anopheles aquasalis]|uniref:bifunctional peptidase and arginyl-hydroxylase JMJD5 n=1 Tax=Anopheles aquasalis TaxID=42839 RepID=UPI00215B33CB|nr:bifunctional peptidase and arginyl-hydroxylase JMJD5 [Anopheles aquasalis]
MEEIIKKSVNELLAICPRKTFFDRCTWIQKEPLVSRVIQSTVDSLEPGWCASAINMPQNLIKIGLIYDTVYNQLHTGQWKEVEPEKRELFTILSFLRIVHILLVSKDVLQSLKDGIYLADLGLMLGSSVASTTTNSPSDLLTESASILSTNLSQFNAQEPPLKRIKIEECETATKDSGISCDVPVLECPSLDYFGKNCYGPQQPALLRKIMNDWPAMNRWHDLNYLLRVAGERTVPVETGSQYSNDDWSQKLMKFGEFLMQSVATDRNQANDPVSYLAQHDLFDQIPALRRDIIVPDYIGCTDIAPRIRAWLGPKGTVSPLHTDPCHNLLCQVFGSKTIILARPEDTDKLYPHEHFILNNTSRVDARQPDYERFPLLREVRFYRVTLRRGEVLYIPPKWWHYVESLSPSFSVSFWFE